MRSMPPCAARRSASGFSFEGVFRQATVYKGRNRDTAWYAVIDDEWSALKKAFDRWLRPDNFDKNGRQQTRLSNLTGLFSSSMVDTNATD
jgi:hypothetical protein